MRSILKFKRPSRRVLPGLNALKTSLEIISRAGSTLPPLQAVADTALEIIKCAETAKKNRKEAVELVEFARKIIETIVDLPPTSEDCQANEKYEEHVLALHKELVTISLRMQELAHSGSVLRRIFHRSEDAEAIAANRVTVDRELILFMVRSIRDDNRKIMAGLRTMNANIQASGRSQPKRAGLNVRVPRARASEGGRGVVVARPARMGAVVFYAGPGISGATAYRGDV